MASQKNHELFELMDELEKNWIRIEHYAIQRTKSGKRISGRLAHIEQHALEVETIAKKIQQHVQRMRRD